MGWIQVGLYFVDTSAQPDQLRILAKNKDGLDQKNPFYFFYLFFCFANKGTHIVLVNPQD